MKMYVDYFKERHAGGEVFYDEGVGFIACQFSKDECYIAESFVCKEARLRGEAKKMFSAVCETARSHGCKVVTAEVDVNSLNASVSLLACLSVGLKVCDANARRIRLYKEI